MGLAGLMAVSMAASPFLDDPKAASRSSVETSATPSSTRGSELLSTEEPSASPAPADTTLSSVAPEPATTEAGGSSKAAAGALLYQAANGDGDSWKDTSGQEYRMGLINAPEYNECGGTSATNKRKSLLASGFRATVYTTDQYGRAVSEIFTASGTNLNIYLARYGFANDKFLATFRSERPALAAQLDQAFAAAKAEKRGVWGTCTSASTTKPAPTKAPVQSSTCHRDYITCIPVKGDGSGAGEANDLDCGDIREKVQLRQAGVDPYRLDNDSDGYGCDSYG